MCGNVGEYVGSTAMIRALMEYFDIQENTLIAF